MRVKLLALLAIFAQSVNCSTTEDPWWLDTSANDWLRDEAGLPSQITRIQARNICFRHLGITNMNVDTREVRLAYMRMALANHPDKLASLPVAERNTGEEKFKLVKKMYEWLIDEDNKAFDAAPVPIPPNPFAAPVLGAGSGTGTPGRAGWGSAGSGTGGSGPIPSSFTTISGSMATTTTGRLSKLHTV